MAFDNNRGIVPWSGILYCRNNGISLAALNLFFVAVLLVIIGTYCLFTTGSIAVLKMLRKIRNIIIYQNISFLFQV